MSNNTTITKKVLQTQPILFPHNAITKPCEQSQKNNRNNNNEPHEWIISQTTTDLLHYLHTQNTIHKYILIVCMHTFLTFAICYSNKSVQFVILAKAATCNRQPSSVRCNVVDVCLHSIAFFDRFFFVAIDLSL